MKYIIALVISLFVISCSDNNDNVTGGQQDIPEAQMHPTYYQYDFSNYTMDDGFIHNGWFIDSLGNIRAFNFTEDNGSWNNANNAGFISADALLSNMYLQNNILGSIERNQLSQMNALAEGLNGVLSEEYQIDSTGGAAYLYAYRWNDQQQMYQRFTIGQGGDFLTTSLSPEGAQLTDYLLALGRSHPNFVWD